MNLDNLIHDQIRLCFVRFQTSLFLYISRYSKYSREEYKEGGTVHSRKLCKNEERWIETLNTKVVGNCTVLKDLAIKTKIQQKA